ncbi:Siderochrome iron transporter 2 [Fulvia fulva]|nr:Siderochrome iron transporter 2 [Fulvia fulva]WPV18913.1 Siderochrome iron transporter 2 [Fulvia fulva]WPV34033.1 Siderochrome iron transporter 2 [Fulvia fulva]
MRVFDQVRNRRTNQIAAGTDHDQTAFKDETKVSHDVEGSGSDSDNLSLEAKEEKRIQEAPDQVTSDAQAGIQKAEAAALVWSKTAIFGVYAWIWVCYFMLAFQSSIQSYVTVYAYSAFTTAPAITTATILSNIIGGVLKLPIAKLINIWGRAEGFMVFVVVYLIGLIILTASNGPNTYAAGYVLYWIGYDAIYLILDIFIADTFGLRNRALAFAFASTPFICTAFTGPLAADSFLSNKVTGAGWRWGLGTFAIVNFFVFTPLAIVFKMYTLKAKKMGLYKSNPSGRTTTQSIIHYFHEFDIPGALILCAAFILFLLPFSLQSYGRINGYDSAAFIAMVVIGLLLFPTFYIWERYFARVHFIRWELFRSRTVLGACILASILYFSFYAWDLNFYNFVIVVYALPVSLAGYVGQIYNVGSCFWSCVFGVYIRYTKHFKYAALFFGLPLMILGSGLMIKFRGGDGELGYVIMCQIFIAFAGGTLVISEDMAVMSAADREGVPLMLSMLYLFSSMGGAIGQAVATAIYSNTFVSAALSKLPANRAAKASELYLGGYTQQIMFPPGTVEREAINYAWGRTQYYGCIASTCILVLAIPAIAVWKNYRVDRQQNKGTML